MKKTRRPARLPRQVAPDSAEREYQRFLRKYVLKYIGLMRQGLGEVVPALREVAAEELPRVRSDSAYFVSKSIARAIRMDENIEEKLRKVMEWANDRLAESFPDAVIGRWAKAMIGRVNQGSKKNTVKAIKSAFKNKKEVPDFEPLFTDKKLSPYFQNIIDENVGLIKSIPKRNHEALKNQLVSLITQDAPHAQIAEALSKHFLSSKKDAKRIAQDQIGKLNGQLNQYRQQQLGGKRYRWRTSKDERVAGNPSGKYPKAKPSHWKREGKVYKWSEPPKGGHPGQRIKCRCWAEMILDDILD